MGMTGDWKPKEAQKYIAAQMLSEGFFLLVPAIPFFPWFCVLSIIGDVAADQ